jgi:hypothetical protein
MRAIPVRSMTEPCDGVLGLANLEMTDLISGSPLCYGSAAIRKCAPRNTFVCGVLRSWLNISKISTNTLGLNR